MQEDILNKNNIIQFVFLVLIILSSGLAWSGLRGILFGDGGWIMPIIAFFIVLVLLSVSWILLRSKIILSAVLLIILISFFLFFGFNWIYLITSLIALLFFYFGSIRTINEKDFRLKIKVSNILRQGLPTFLIGLILLISVAYYFSPKAQISFQIPRPLFDSIMEVVPLPSNFQANAENAKSVGLEKEQKDEIYTLINKIISDWTESYKQYFTIGAAIVMFLTLKGLSVIFIWLTVFMGWLVFKILIILGAVKIQEKAALQKIIEI